MKLKPKIGQVVWFEGGLYHDFEPFEAEYRGDDMYLELEDNSGFCAGSMKPYKYKSSVLKAMMREKYKQISRLKQELLILKLDLLGLEGKEKVRYMDEEVDKNE